MLDAALDTVSEAIVADVVAIGSCDVVLAVGSSGLERRGCGLGRGAVDQPGIQRHLSGGAGSSSEVGEEQVVVVVNDVGIVDGGCAGIISGDVAVLTGVINDAEGVGVAEMGCVSI